MEKGHVYLHIKASIKFHMSIFHAHKKKEGKKEDIYGSKFSTHPYCYVQNAFAIVVGGLDDVQLAVYAEFVVM